MDRRWKRFAFNFSLTTWKSRSTCLVRSWNLGFWVMCLAVWLSQQRMEGRKSSICRSWSKYVSHCNSQVVAARALYSTSDEERETVLCFLVFQDINDAPRKMQKPMVDLRVSRQEA